jgi:hypothetical protein
MYATFWLNYDNMFVLAMAIPFMLFGVAIAGTVAYVKYLEN